MKRMGGYVRVSTKGQEERGESPEVQEARIREYCDNQGWEVTIYREAKSAKDEKHRPKFQSLLADLEAGRADGVIATSLDRMWRDFIEQHNGINLIHHQWGRTVVVLDENLNLQTAAGRLVTRMKAVVSQHERERTSERVTDVMRWRAEQGKWNGGPPPHGYSLPEKKKPLVINREEATIVRDIFRLFLQKGTIRGVTLALNHAGKRTRRGQLWANQTIRRILTSPLYIGMLIYNKRNTTGEKTTARGQDEHILVPEALPAIVDAATFTAVQDLLATRPVLAPRAQASNYLLAGLVKCGACGRGMAGASLHPRGKKRRYRYYKCYSYCQKGRTACTGTSIDADKLENVVVESLFDLRVNADKLHALLTTEWEERTKAISPLKREIARLERDVKAIAARDDKIMLAFEEGAYSVEEMTARRAKAAEDLNQAQTALVEAQADLARATADTTNSALIAQCLEHGFDLYEANDFEERRNLMQALVEQITVEEKTRGHFTLRDLETLGGWLEGTAGTRGFKFSVRRQTGARADI